MGGAWLCLIKLTTPSSHASQSTTTSSKASKSSSISVNCFHPPPSPTLHSEELVVVDVLARDGPPHAREVPSAGTVMGMHLHEFGRSISTRLDSVNRCVE